MYYLFISIQYIGMIILMAEILYILRQSPSRLQIKMLIIALATLINFIGYLMEMQAGSKEIAFQAVKFLYIGKPFIILATFLFIMEFYHINIPGWLKYLLCALHLSISLLVFTNDRHFLFYSSIDYTQEGYFPHLVLGHSLIYKAYSGIVLLYLLILIGAGIYKYSRTDGVKEKKQILFLTIVTIVAGMGFAVYFSGIMKGYDTTLLAYLICTVLLLIAMMRYNLLDTVAMAKERVVDEFADGLLVLDEYQHPVYTNRQFMNIYPDFDQKNKEEIIEKLQCLNRDKQRLLIDRRVYEVMKKEIIKQSITYGTMLVLRDITEIYDYMERLKSANQAKSDFLAKMSHEIRTPIHAVLGMDEMILRESGEPEIKNYAADIKTSANTLLALINDILDTSRIESGKLEIISTTYTLDSLLNDVGSMIFVKARDKRLEYIVNVDETIPNGLIGDDVRIRQILVNLLNNAVKYTEKGNVTLELTAVTERSEVDLHFKVRDTGIGIKEEDLPKLYEAFERIEEKKNHNIEGTGLGMNIVLELLKLMGSSLTVESVYGEGTVFSFTLRQHVADSEPIGDFGKRSRNVYQEEHYEAGFTAPSARILLVDDNAVNRRVFMGLLKQTKIQIVEAASGFECLELAGRERFDIIFMDHMMPKMDGIETLHRMKRIVDCPCADTPVIILTANAIVGAKEKYLQEGFDNYLSKPIQGIKLEEMVRRYLPKDSCISVSPADTGTDLPASEDIFGEFLELPEFDIAYARQYFNEDGLLLMTMRDVYGELPYVMESLQMKYEDIIKEGQTDAGQALSEYRTKVHALKSNTAMIGALILSKLARLLELAAIDGNIERIKELHPILLEELDKHKSYMHPLGMQEREDSKDAAEDSMIENEGDTWI